MPAPLRRYSGESCFRDFLFLTFSSFPQALLKTPEIIQRVTFEVVEDAWHDGVRLLELRYSPYFGEIISGFPISFCL